MRPYTLAILDHLAEHGPLTAFELRKLNGVDGADRRTVNAHAFSIVEATTKHGVHRIADGRYALEGHPHETLAEQQARRASAMPLPSRVTPYTNKEMRGFTIASLDALHNIVADEFYDEMVEEVIQRFDRCVIVLRDDIKRVWTKLALADFGAVHHLTADQVDLCRRAAERKHDYYEAGEAIEARRRYETLYDAKTDVIERWWSKAAHKAWITRGENALLAKRKLYTYFFELRYEFAGETHRDGALCVSQLQARQALARAKSRIRRSLIGAEILSAQVAPFAKERVRVKARMGLSV